MKVVPSADVVPRTRPGLARLSKPKQALLDRRLRGANKGAAFEIPHRGAREAPLSFAQLRLWFLDQLEPGQPVYHVPLALRLRGPLNISAAARTLTEIVNRHEALRTRFEPRDGSAIQVVLEAAELRVDLHRLDHLQGEALDAELRRRLLEEGSRPFDLASGVLIRAAAFRLAPEDHVLLITMHHIASDARSIDVLLKEFVAGYAALVHGDAPEWPPLPIQYSDYAAWQQEQAVGARLREQLEFWRNKLRGAPTYLELPTDWPRSAIVSARGQTRSLLLPEELRKRLEHFAQDQNATMFMVLLAGFKALLHCYSGQDDLVIGTPVSRRTQKETENLIGFFLNTLVLRTDCSGDPSFCELLCRVRETALESYAHQQVPFERLVEELQPERDAGRTPVFQVMFTYQERRHATAAADGLTVEAFDVDLGVAPFDMTLLIQQSERGLLAQVEYKTDLYRPETIDRMLEHFRTLLEGAVANPAQKLSDLPLLTEAEREQILTTFNPKRTEALPNRCLHDYVEDQVVKAPDATAIRFGSQYLTYGELDQRANQLAHYLRELGVSTEALVGICVERSPEMVIAVLAVLKAGAAYVPLEPDEAPERLRFKLEDSGVSILISQSFLFSALEPLPSQTRALLLDREKPAIARASRQPIKANCRPEHLAYMIYTSGSTGKPKGVLVEHRALVCHSLGFIRQFGLQPTDRVLQFAPLSFDVSAEEIFPALIAGATLVLRPAGLAVSIQDFHPFVTHEKLTILNLPTPYWAQWLAEMESRKLELPPAVRLVIVGSDTVSPEQYARWRKFARPGVRWCNAYGTTEATITATIYEPQHDEVLPVVPIGRPTQHTRVYILNASGKLAPIGVPGEIYIGGDEVARGYWRRPELTRTRFVPDTFCGRHGMRLNRTGDFGRWLPDGNIEFLGRRDNQVKVRGFRIELSEVESALLSFGAIREAVVVAREDGGEKRLVAYYVPAREGVTAGPIQTFLKARLPAYMVPSAIISIPELPMLPSGKIDRKALPAPSSDRPDLEVEYVPPSDSLEEKLAVIWRGVLGLARIGVHDNFFNLGGHSLLAVRLFAEIERITGWDLPLLTLFQSPTIKALADAIRRRQVEQTGACLVPVQPLGTHPPLYLVHGAGGGMLWGYANLSKHLGDDYPVYVFNSPAPRELENLQSTEALAHRYVQELRAFQPDGPYHLGGYCFGGEIAFEMARQLVAAGQRVAMLAVMNSMPPNSKYERITPTPGWLVRFVWNSWHWFGHFCHWTPEQRRSFLFRKTRFAWKLTQGMLGLRGNETMEAAAEDQIDVSLYSDDQRKLWDIHLRASANYKPAPYSGRMIVFRTGFHPFLCSFERSYGWSEFAQGGLDVRIVRGTHESILDEPYVQEVARELKRLFPDPAEAMRTDSRLEKVGQVVISSCLWLVEFAPAL